jgi:hypothetical protein
MEELMAALGKTEQEIDAKLKQKISHKGKTAANPLQDKIEAAVKFEGNIIQFKIPKNKNTFEVYFGGRRLTTLSLKGNDATQIARMASAIVNESSKSAKAGDATYTLIMEPENKAKLEQAIAAANQ